MLPHNEPIGHRQSLPRPFPPPPLPVRGSERLSPAPRDPGSPPPPATAPGSRHARHRQAMATAGRATRRRLARESLKTPEHKLKIGEDGDKKVGDESGRVERGGGGGGGSLRRGAQAGQGGQAAQAGQDTSAPMRRLKLAPSGARSGRARSGIERGAAEWRRRTSAFQRTRVLDKGGGRKNSSMPNFDLVSPPVDGSVKKYGIILTMYRYYMVRNGLGSCDDRALLCAN